jgi:hypothetical protein
VGDFNDDGEIDIFAAHFAHSGQTESQFFKNNGQSGNYTFQDMGQSGVQWQESYASSALGDYDNDGDLDLFFTTVYESDSPRMYRNDGNFNFTDVTSSLGLSGIGQTYRAAFADYDNDGDLDLTTGGSLFENQGNSNHWIKLKMVGDSQSINRDAIGAQVRIQANGKTYTRQVEAGTGEGNQNDPTLHFGLGSHSGTVDLDILWPGGTTSQITGLAVDQLHSLDTIEIGTQGQVPLTPSSVIGGSASINDGGSQWDSTDPGGQEDGFNGTNITDGDKSEDGIDSFWIVNTDGAGGEPGYLVIDLGDTYNIDQIDLYNTHNRTGNNFGTGDFRIEASNSVVDTGSPYDFDLSGTIETILTGNLSDTSGEDPITTADSFTSITPHTEGAVRYLRFNSLSGIYGDNDLRGLNEIEVFIDTTATDFTWIPSNFGDWADNDNWSFQSGLTGVGVRANSPDHTAIFGDGISGPTTVSTQAAVSVNRVVFDNDTNSYAIAGLGSVNLASTTGPSPVTPTISVTGTHEFQVVVSLSANTTVTVGDAAQLDFNDQLHLGNNDLTINRDPNGVTNDGVVNINNIVLGTGTITNNATLAAASSISVGGNLISGGTLDFDITPYSAGQFNVSGSASLDGTINVDFLDGETPSDIITLLTSANPIVFPGGNVGSLGLNVTGASGLSLAVGGGGTTLLLTATVPEPTGLVLMGLALLVQLSVARCRATS